MAPPDPSSPRSMLALPAAVRLLIAAGALAFLWLAVLWSVWLP